MPIAKKTTNGFFKRVYGGQTETVCLLKREDDQRAGIIKSITLYNVRWEQIYKAGEPYQGSMSSSHRRLLLVHREELDYAGVNYINATDRFRDEQGRHWQPESTTMIDNLIFENVVRVHCLRCDTPDKVL